MDAILAAHNALEQKCNLSKAVDDVQKLIDQLQEARDAVAADPARTPVIMAKLKTPAKQSFDKIEDDLKEINKGLNQYSKALKDKFKGAALPTSQYEVLKTQPTLIDRAIEMHLLREGQFKVARTFSEEVKNAQQLKQRGRDPAAPDGDGVLHQTVEDIEDADADAMDEDGKIYPESDGRYLQKEFAQMYDILHALRLQHNLGPAIEWAKQHSAVLENRGSNLEFELARLKFVELYTSEQSDRMGHFEGPARALAYARDTFPNFSSRYLAETSSLLGSLAFSSGLERSPYQNLFYNQDAWEEVSNSFTREFCATLGMTSQSPLYTAVTAGGIALPVLEKFERVMAQARGQWTSVNELPVETPLPPSMQFHSIFVCPVSKEQATDANPPMMMSCGHVIAKESLEMHSRGKSRMKCPYCPNESLPRDAKRLYIG